MNTNYNKLPVQVFLKRQQFLKFVCFKILIPVALQNIVDNWNKLSDPLFKNGTQKYPRLYRKKILWDQLFEVPVHAQVLQVPPTDLDVGTYDPKRNKQV